MSDSFAKLYNIKKCHKTYVLHIILQPVVIYFTQVSNSDPSSPSDSLGTDLEREVEFLISVDISAKKS